MVVINSEFWKEYLNSTCILKDLNLKKIILTWRWNETARKLAILHIQLIKRCVNYSSATFLNSNITVFYLTLQKPILHWLFLTFQTLCSTGLNISYQSYLKIFKVIHSLKLFKLPSYIKQVIYLINITLK